MTMPSLRKQTPFINAEKIAKLFRIGYWTRRLAARFGYQVKFIKEECFDEYKRFAKELEKKGFGRIKKKFSPNAKFLDVERNLLKAVRHARQLNMHKTHGLDVLDIGTGVGFFPWVLRGYGHRALAVDLDVDPKFNEVTKFLHVDRRVWEVRRFEKLPDFGRKFDLITGFNIDFDRNNTPMVWGAREWVFFLGDAAGHLKEGGKLHLKLNRDKKSGMYYRSDVCDLFLKKGATLELGRSHVHFDNADRFCEKEIGEPL